MGKFRFTSFPTCASTFSKFPIQTLALMGAPDTLDAARSARMAMRRIEGMVKREGTVENTSYVGGQLESI